jgi:hypothetical protein
MLNAGLLTHFSLPGKQKGKNEASKERKRLKSLKTPEISYGKPKTGVV